MKKKISSLLAFLFILGDLFFLNLAIVWSYKIRGIVLLDREITDGIYLIIFSSLTWFFLILVTNPYRVSPSRQYSVVLRSHFSFVLVHLMIIFSLILFYDKQYDALQLAWLYVFFIPVIFFWRLLYFYTLSFIIKRPLNSVNFIIIGKGEAAEEIRKNFRFHPEYGYRFLGYFDGPDDHSVTTLPSDEIEKFCVEKGVGEIFWCLPDRFNSELKGIIDFSLTYFIKVKRVTDNSAFYQRGLQPERTGLIPVMDLVTIPLDDAWNQFVKRVFDLSFTTVVSVLVLSWLLPLISILIKMDSRGPVFYRQLRAGKGNKPFLCIKFRTMVADNKTEFVQATRNDPRVTRMGRFLRKTSLDEFPQFINVLIGDMSIVGPRPHPIKLNEDYSPKIKKLMSRHYVKPGITGLAQCMGYRGETINLSDMKNRITLDRFYVENWSLIFDIRIIFQTVISLLTGGAKAY